MKKAYNGLRYVKLVSHRVLSAMGLCGLFKKKVAEHCSERAKKYPLSETSVNTKSVLNESEQRLKNKDFANRVYELLAQPECIY